MNVKISKEESTVLKAVSILTVILTHANGAQAFVGIPILHNSVFTSLLCQGGMCTFLLLSGYGLYCSYQNKGFDGWWDNKFEKIFFPAIVIQSLWYVISQLYIYIVNHDIQIDYSTIVLDILCFNPHNGIDGSVWYLSYLLFCYTMFYVCFRYIPIKLSSFIFFIIYIIMVPVSATVWGNNFYCVSSFGLGVIWGILATQRKSIISSNKILKVLGVGIAVIVAIIYFFEFRRNWIIDNVASNIVAIGYILFFSFFDCKKMRILYFIGVNSFILYLLQGKTISRFPYDNYPIGFRVFIYLVLLIAMILLAWAINYVINAYLRFVKEKGVDVKNVWK